MRQEILMGSAVVVIAMGVCTGVIVSTLKPQVEVRREVKMVAITPSVTATPSATLAPLRGNFRIVPGVTRAK